MIEQPTRRGFLRGLGAALAAPAIVSASSLMPIKAVRWWDNYPISLNGTPIYFDNIDPEMASLLLRRMDDAQRAFDASVERLLSEPTPGGNMFAGLLKELERE